MKKTKQIVAILVALLIMLSCCFVSCKQNKEKEDASDSIQNQQSESNADSDSNNNVVEPVEDRVISANGTVNYSIVIPEGLATTVSESVKSLHESLMLRSGGVSVKLDIADPKNHNADTYEILVGNTGYPETKQALSELTYGEWTLQFVGNKLVVAGFSDIGVSNAISELMKKIKQEATKEGTIIFKSDLNVTKTEHEILDALPLFENTELPITADEGSNTGLAIVPNASVEDYTKYLSKLEANGYEFYTSNDIVDNKFATYENGEYVIHAGYYAYESSMRVTIEKKTTMVGLESENVYEKNDKIVTSLAAVGCDEGAKEGMSYCYQLDDGSFIAIDGGGNDDCIQLYEYMRAKAPGEKIVIAAWFLSHHHGDHRGCFQNFTKRYTEDVVIERFIHHLPASSKYYDSGEPEDTTLLAAAYALPGCEVIKVHTGQKLYIRNAVIEVLYTLDGFLPRFLWCFNDSSIVISIEVEGERALFLADASDETAEILHKMYGDYLKCDILQLAHHGIRNSHGMNMPQTIKLYQYVRPEMVLMPSSHTFYLSQEPTTSPTFLKWNLEAFKSAREIHVAGDQTTVFELPYSLYSAYKFIVGETHEPVYKDAPSTTDSLKYEPLGQMVSVNWND